MNRAILLFVMLLLSFKIEAKKSNDNFRNDHISRYHNNDAITFIENGIRFRVFLDGNFDFDRRLYRNRRDHRRIRIERDFRGRVRRVGNVFINYNFRGDLSRIGSVFMQYNRRGLLTRIGNLKIVYNRWGDPTFYGRVRYNDSYNFFDNYPTGFVYNYNNPFFYRSGFNRNYRQFNEDSNFYYYKAQSDDGEIKKGDVIKRRKSTEDQKKRTSSNEEDSRKRRI